MRKIINCLIHPPDVAAFFFPSIFQFFFMYSCACTKSTLLDEDRRSIAFPPVRIDLLNGAFIFSCTSLKYYSLLTECMVGGFCSCYLTDPGLLCVTENTEWKGIYETPS